MAKRKPAKTFGQLLREKRVEGGYSLRKFAKLVEVSPTYLSQVEQGNVDPPTAERAQRIAELLDENVDQWTALAGRLTGDIPGIIQERPTELPDMLRAMQGLSVDQLKTLRKTADRMKSKGKGK